MKVVLSRLWSEQQGAIISAEIVLVASILVLGVVVGLASLRDSVVTELADVGQAIGNLDQSFSFSGVMGHHVFTGGGFFFDTFDFCDTPFAFGWNNGMGGCNGFGNFQQSKCVMICTAPLHPLGVGSDGF